MPLSAEQFGLAGRGAFRVSGMVSCKEMWAKCGHKRFYDQTQTADFVAIMRKSAVREKWAQRGSNPRPMD